MHAMTRTQLVRLFISQIIAVCVVCLYVHARDGSTPKRRNAPRKAIMVIVVAIIFRDELAVVGVTNEECNQAIV